MKRKPQEGGDSGEAPVPSSQRSALTSNLQPPHLASFPGGYNPGYYPVHHGMHPSGAAADDRMRALTAHAHAIAQHQQMAAALAHNAAGGYTAAVQFPAGAGGNTSGFSLFNFHASVFCCIPAIIVTVSQAAREKGGGGRCRKGEARDGNTERWLEKECARECAK
jgi:hypothetical protein